MRRFEHLMFLCKSLLQFRELMVVLIVFHISQLSIAQTASFTTRINDKYIVENSQFQISFVLKNANGRNFIPPDFTPFKIRSGPNQFSSTQIINGRRSSELSYNYVLLAPAAGNYTIPSASMEVNGKTISTDVLELQVVATPTASALDKSRTAADAPAFFIRASLSKDTVVVGEQIYLNYEIFTTKDIRGISIVDAPELADFYTEGVGLLNRNSRREDIQGTIYTVQLFRRFAIYPQRKGDYSIEPANCRIEISEGRDNRGFFAFPKISSRFLKTNELQIHVTGLPEPKPEHFFGAIGRQKIKLEVNKFSLSTDDVITSTLSVSGPGDPNRISDPFLDGGEFFEVFLSRKKKPDFDFAAGEIIHHHVWEYELVPMTSGSFEFAPIFSFFDPDSSKYINVQSDTISFSISPVKRSTKFDQFDNSRLKDFDLSLARTPVSKSSGNYFFGSPLFWALFSLPFLMLLISYIRKRVNDKKLRRISARSPREKVIDEFSAIKKEGLTADRLRYVLESYFSNELGLELTAIQSETLITLADKHGKSVSYMQKYFDLIDSLDNLLFAGIEDHSRLREIYEEALNWIRSA